MKILTLLFFLSTAQAQVHCCPVQGITQCGTKLTCDPPAELACAEGLVKWCTFGFGAHCECIPDNGQYPQCGGTPGMICSEADDGRCFCYQDNTH